MELLDSTNISGLKYQRIIANNGLIENTDGSLTLRAALVNIQTGNYDRDFAAVAYVRYIINGESKYLYTDRSDIYNSRNILYVASEALADVSVSKTGKYIYPVTSYLTKDDNGEYSVTNASAYSKYTDTQRGVINNYVEGRINYTPSEAETLEQTTATVLDHTSDIFRPLGRTYARNSALACDFTCTGIEFSAYCGGSVYVKLNTSALTYFTVYVDGVRQENRVSATSSSTGWIEIAYGLDAGDHTIMLVKQSQFTMATTELVSVMIYGEFNTGENMPADRERFIEFYGDSILNGSNVYRGGTSTQTSDGTYGFGWIASQLLGADCNIIGHGGLGLVDCKQDYAMLDLYKLNGSINVSGVTEYDFARIPDAVVIELGINDYVNSDLKNDPDTYAEGVKTFIANMRAKYGNDVPIIWLYGYRSGYDFWDTTKAALDEVIAAGDTNVYYCQVSQAYLDNPADGDIYHPDVALAQNFGSEVAAHIKRILGWS